MELFSAISTESIADRLFVSSSQNQVQLEVMSNQALSNGIDLYVNKDYEAAANAFQKAINLSPLSSYSVDATKYLAQTYLKLDKTDKAIQTYENALSRHRDRDDLYTDLGNLYFSEDRFDDAVNQYEQAARINPSANNLFSLGQGYIKTGEFNKAEKQFNTYIRMEPDSAYGYYGLGQAYSEQGYFEDAIEQFETALDKQRDFFDVYVDMGYAYADLGKMEEAREMQEFLEKNDGDLASLVRLYINDVEPPKLQFAWADSSFRYNMSINTPLAAMDTYFEAADASKIMTMKFQFSKQMDRKSIENPYHWTISKASGANLTHIYNYGEPVPSTDISLPHYPENIYYDSAKMIATLYFSVDQNATADGTIDPSHIIFKFNGEDANGISIDSDFDEYSGFSGVA